MALTPRTDAGMLYGFFRDWFPLIALIVSMGIAWGTMNSRVDQKLDSIRFVSDSAMNAAVSARQDAEIQEQRVEIREAINRLSQLVCYGSHNPACR